MLVMHVHGYMAIATTTKQNKSKVLTNSGKQTIAGTVTLLRDIPTDFKNHSFFKF